MKDYNKTLWEDNITLVDARKLNNIEEQVDSITDKILEVESSLNKNIDAIDQACTAITGEKFHSIDERIDSEIERLNKKIDVSMLQQEDNENHTINNSINGMTTNMIIKGKTIQNLCDTTIRISKGSIYINNDTNKELFKSGDYTLKNTSGKILYCNIYDKTNNVKIREVRYTKNTLITLKDNEFVENIIGNFDMDWHKSDEDKELLKQQCIVLKGDYTDSINFFEGIKSFGQEENKINITSNNKNLIDINELKVASPNDIVEVTTKNNSINIKIKKSQEWITAGVFKIKVKKNTEYIFGRKINIHKYGHNDSTWGCGLITIKNNKDEKLNSIEEIGNPKSNFPKGFGENIQSKTFNSGNNNYIWIFIKGTTSPVSKDEFANFNISDLFLYESNSDNIYQEHENNKKTILLEKYQLEDGLKSVFDKKDEINSIENKVIKRINKYTITGNENFVGDLRENYLYISVPLEGCKPGSGNEAICSHFSYIDGLWNKDDIKVKNKEGFDLSGNNILSFQIATNKLETPDTTGFKKYFKKLYDAGTPVEVYYELLNPIIKELKDDINIKTYNKKTYIKFDNSIQGENSFKAPIDTKETLSTLKKENEDIKAILNSILEKLNKQ